MESDIITLQDVFVARPVGERTRRRRSTSFLRPLECTGLQPHFQQKLAGHGVILPEDFYQPEPPIAVVSANGGGDDDSLCST